MISLPARGALSVLSLEVERELTEDDLLQLQFMPENSPPTLQKISARHRRTAMMVAEGRTNEHIAECMGYTSTRVGQLRNDPSFQELVGYYESQIMEVHILEEQRVRGKLLDLTEDALDEMQRRMDGEDATNRISYSELRQTAIMGADRTVAPPKAIVNTQPPPPEITLNFGTTLRPRPSPPIVDVTPEELETVAKNPGSGEG